jgi:hypothetical protein
VIVALETFKQNTSTIKVKLVPFLDSSKVLVAKLLTGKNTLANFRNFNDEAGMFYSFAPDCITRTDKAKNWFL